MLVSIGGGDYYEFECEMIEARSSRRLLEAIKTDDYFADELKDVPLSKCTVHVAVSKDSKRPDAGAKEAKLEGTETLGKLVEAKADGNIFIRVALPAVAIGEIMEL